MVKSANGSSVFLYLMAYIISYYSLTFLHLSTLIVAVREKEKKDCPNYFEDVCFVRQGWEASLLQRFLIFDAFLI